MACIKTSFLTLQSSLINKLPFDQEFKIFSNIKKNLLTCQGMKMTGNGPSLKQKINFWQTLQKFITRPTPV